MNLREVQNITLRQLVTIHGNSGKTWHLPPAFTAEIPEIEIIPNTMVDKLVKKKCIFIHPEKKEITEGVRTTKKKEEESGKSEIKDNRKEIKPPKGTKSEGRTETTKRLRTAMGKKEKSRKSEIKDTKGEKDSQGD